MEFSSPTRRGRVVLLGVVIVVAVSIAAFVVYKAASDSQNAGAQPKMSEPSAEQKALQKVFADAAAVRANMLGEAKAQLEAVEEEVSRKGPTPETTEQIARLKRTISNVEKLNEEARQQFETEYRKFESPKR